MLASTVFLLANSSVTERIPMGRASMSKITRGKCNVDTRLGEEIEGGRAKLTDGVYGCSKDIMY